MGWMDGRTVMGWARGEKREAEIFQGSLTPVPVKVLYSTATGYSSFSVPVPTASGVPVLAAQ